MVSSPKKLGFLPRSSLWWLGAEDIADDEEVKMKFQKFSKNGKTKYQ